jgi:hypothetical protein
MQAIHINHRLFIVVGEPRGILINCFVGSETGVMDIFNVALFFGSVTSMVDGLKQGKSWESGDQYFAISGRGSEITLTFKMQAPPFGEVDVALNEKDSKKFMHEMEKIAEGN